MKLVASTKKFGSRISSTDEATRKPMPTMLRRASTRAGSASSTAGETVAPKTVRPMMTSTAPARLATARPEMARPSTSVSGRVGVSQAGSSVPASISRFRPNAISQKAVATRPLTTMPRNR